MEDDGFIFEEMGTKMPEDHLGRCSAPVSPTRPEGLIGKGVQLTLFSMVSLELHCLVCSRQSKHK